MATDDNLQSNINQGGQSLDPTQNQSGAIFDTNLPNTNTPDTSTDSTTKFGPRNTDPRAGTPDGVESSAFQSDINQGGQSIDPSQVQSQVDGEIDTDLFGEQIDTRQSNLRGGTTDPVSTAKEFGFLDEEGQSQTQESLTPDEETSTITAPEGSTLQEVAQGSDVSLGELSARNPNIAPTDTLKSETDLTVPTTRATEGSAVTATTPEDQQPEEPTTDKTISFGEMGGETTAQQLDEQLQQAGGQDDATNFVQTLQQTEQIAGRGFRQEEQEADQLEGRIESQVGRFEEKPDRVKNLRQKFGFQDNLSKLQDIRQQREQLAGEFEQLITEAEGRPVASPLISGRKQQLRSQKASEVGALASVEQALSDNVAQANRLAKQTANIEFQPVEKKIENLRNQLDRQRADMTRSEKRRANRIEKVLNERQRIVEKKKKEREDVVNFANQIAQKGAGSDVIRNITQAENLEQAIQEAQPFLKKVKDFQRAQDVATTLGTEDEAAQERETDFVETEQGKQLVDTQTGEVLRTFDTAQEQDQEQAAKTQRTQEILNQARSVLNDPGFDAFVGPVSSVFNTPEVLGGRAGVFQDKLDKLINNLTLGKLDQISGAISDQELKLAKEAATNLRVNMPQEEFKKELKRIIGNLQEGLRKKSGGEQQQDSGIPDFKQELSTSQKGSQPDVGDRVDTAVGQGTITAFGSDFWSPGLDIALEGGKNADVKAPASGKVIATRPESETQGFGNQVKIRTPKGDELWISHLSNFDVEEGETVRQGETVGKQGNTGSVIPVAGGDGTHVDLTVKDETGEFVPPQEIASKINQFA